MFDKYDDGAKTLGDNKPKRYHIYMYSENKVKSHKATISNIFVYYQYKILLQQKKKLDRATLSHTVYCLLNIFNRNYEILFIFYLWSGISYHRVLRNRSWFVIHSEVLKFYHWILCYHELFHDKIKR